MELSSLPSLRSWKREQRGQDDDYSRSGAVVLPVFNVVIILFLLRYYLREIQKLSASGEG